MARLLYDADCGFCARTARLVPRLAVTADVAAIQDSDLVALGVDPDRALVEMPFVYDDGRVVYGHHAWAAGLGTGPLPLRILGRLLGSRLASPVMARVYAWVAANRHRLPGGTAQCSPEDRRR